MTKQEIVQQLDKALFALTADREVVPYPAASAAAILGRLAGQLGVDATHDGPSREDESLEDALGLIEATYRGNPRVIAWLNAARTYVPVCSPE